MSKPKTQVIIINESLISSTLKDIVTFCLFAGVMLFNHTLLDGNGWIDAIFITWVFLWLSVRKSNQVFNGKKEDAIKWIEEN